MTPSCLLSASQRECSEAVSRSERTELQHLVPSLTRAVHAALNAPLSVGVSPKPQRGVVGKKSLERLNGTYCSGVYALGAPPLRRCERLGSGLRSPRRGRFCCMNCAHRKSVMLIITAS